MKRVGASSAGFSVERKNRRDRDRIERLKKVNKPS